MYNSIAIANAFVEKGEREHRYVTYLKLQKLVYLAYGWHLALYNRALLVDPVVAWEYGPVVRRVHNAFSLRLEGPIRSAASIPFRSPGYQFPDLNTVQFIDRIWEVYGSQTGSILAGKASMKGTPWHTIHRQCPDKDVIIPDELIMNYFDGLRKDGSCDNQPSIFGNGTNSH